MVNKKWIMDSPVKLFRPLNMRFSNNPYSILQEQQLCQMLSSTFRRLQTDRRVSKWNLNFTR